MDIQNRGGVYKIAGRHKKEDSRNHQYRVRLNDQEEKMLNFASQATGVRKSEIFRNALQEYYQKVQRREYVSETEFEDEQWLGDHINLRRVVKCPCCGHSFGIDLTDECTISASENQMGEEILYEFDSVPFKCGICYSTFYVSGFISEYPTGAFNAEEINITSGKELEENKESKY